MSVPGLAREELLRIAPGRETIVTVGKFDGVHRGHQHLVSWLLWRAREAGLASVVLVLHPNPITVLRPGTRVSYLTGLEERLELLRSLGPDRVGVLSFTSELALVSAADFVRLLVETLRMRVLVMGPDMALGRNREGTVETLSAIGRELGFRVEVAPLLRESGKKVGSSAVREALARGDMEEVARLLGHPYSLRGPVVRGEGRGRHLGFPTANIAVAPDKALPPYGVYVTLAHVGEMALPSCTNIGVRPTFPEADPTPTVEAYILDYQGDLYEQEVRLDVLHRLRDELKFDTVDDLIAAMHRDIERTREYFAQLSRKGHAL
ncbi:Riboflavin biosynthesis protein RibF [bacterium HR25]|jgi:riboflavin kinase/FMN adenylyltransferase|nr:Riboflavin biosynthesis protein RibF [bacterium HR25]